MLKRTYSVALTRGSDDTPEQPVKVTKTNGKDVKQNLSTEFDNTTIPETPDRKTKPVSPLAPKKSRSFIDDVNDIINGDEETVNEIVSQYGGGSPSSVIQASQEMPKSDTEYDEYGDPIQENSMASCVDCGISTSGSQFCYVTRCGHSCFREMVNGKWSYSRICDENDCSLTNNAVLEAVKKVTKENAIHQIKMFGEWLNIEACENVDSSVFKPVRVCDSEESWPTRTYHLVHKNAFDQFVVDHRTSFHVEYMKYTAEGEEVWKNARNKVLDNVEGVLKKTVEEVKSTIDASVDKAVENVMKNVVDLTENGDKATQCSSEAEQKQVKMLRASCAPVVYTLLKNMSADICAVKQSNEQLQAELKKMGAKLLSLKRENEDLRQNNVVKALLLKDYDKRICDLEEKVLK